MDGILERLRKLKNQQPRIADSGPPRTLTISELTDVQAEVGDEDAEAVAQSFWNEWVDESEHEQGAWLSRTLDAIAVNIESLKALSKPFLSYEEAGKLIGLSGKRIENIIAAIRRETGQLPEFVVDMGGTVNRRIDREAFAEAVRKRRAFRGRQPKHSY